MKTLFLMRHAKSSWDNPDWRDFDRPLNKRGLEAAQAIGRFIQRNKIEPDVVISSPAVRAKETAELVIEAAELKTDLRFEERIYEASVLDLMKIIGNIKDQINVALLLGHNPGFEGLLFRLTKKSEVMPTAALAKIELNINRWGDVQDSSGKLEWLVKPKDL